MAVLHQSMVDCGGFRTLMENAVVTNGLARPWGLIVYNDGVTPQDSASQHDKRKLVNIYWGFKEHGARFSIRGGLGHYGDHSR